MYLSRCPDAPDVSFQEEGMDLHGIDLQVCTPNLREGIYNRYIAVCMHLYFI